MEKQIDRELKNLISKRLTIKELKVIKKILGRGWKYPDDDYSPKTVEAVLQGRRFNSKIAHTAIREARKELKYCIEVMNNLDKKLKSNNKPL